MVQKEIFKSVPGILRPFKEYLQSLGLAEGDQVVYYGCVGTCTPFVELLAVAVRGLHIEQVYVPLLDETKAKKIVNVDDVGMQVSGGSCPAQSKGARDHGGACDAVRAAGKRRCEGAHPAVRFREGDRCLFHEHVRESRLAGYNFV